MGERMYDMGRRGCVRTSCQLGFVRVSLKCRLLCFATDGAAVAHAVEPLVLFDAGTKRR